MAIKTAVFAVLAHTLHGFSLHL